MQLSFRIMNPQLTQMIRQTWSKRKRAQPITTYTVRSNAPSSQLVWESLMVVFTRKTLITMHMELNIPTSRVKRFRPKIHDKITITGEAKAAICTLLPQAIPMLRSILSFMATITALKCSTALPITGRKMIETKVWPRPAARENSEIDDTIYSEHMLTRATTTKRMPKATLKEATTSSSSSASTSSSPPSRDSLSTAVGSATETFEPPTSSSSSSK
mmetsp:Transcript_20816/g.30247  ORF Transcript_20816/g.30247 Transcript_20816/m.30247 type:complete len:216 (-) Transcript_20816:399-1046(-)